VLSGRDLCDELITRPEEPYRLCCVVVCDLETSRVGAPYIYDISCLRVNSLVAEHEVLRPVIQKSVIRHDPSQFNPPHALITHFLKTHLTKENALR